MNDQIQAIINQLREQGNEVEAQAIEALRASQSSLTLELSRFKQIAGKMYCKM